MVNVIAEFCQNHNGDKSILKEMIHAAKENGATHGKIQTIFADDLSFRSEFENGLVENGEVKAIKRPYQPEYDRLKNLEISLEDHYEFISDCKKVGLIPMTTCFTRGSVQELQKMGFDEIKVASYDCGAIPLIRDLAANFKKIVISTGATYDNEIEDTVKLLKSLGTDFSLLHCVTIYPTPLSAMNLNRMKFLRKFTDKVGLSDHSLVERDGVKSSIFAIYCGASIIERHFTILEKHQTRDGPVSIRPVHLKEIRNFINLNKSEQDNYIREFIPESQTMLGSEYRELSKEELINRNYYRGRFATKLNGKTIYNWEDVKV